MVIGRQGFVFHVVLGRKWLGLWFLGVVPVAGVRLGRIRNIRGTAHHEYWDGGWERWARPWRYWSWPGSPGNPRDVPQGHYVIETDAGTHIWLRLRSGLHYKLREAVHRQRLPPSQSGRGLRNRRPPRGVSS